MNKKGIIVLTLLLCAGVFLFAACDNRAQEEPAPAAAAALDVDAGVAAQQSVTMADSVITVNTTESVKVSPDLAYVYLGVRTTGKTAETAQQENAELAHSFVAAVKKEGVAEEDIETASINIYQDYENPNQYVMESSYKVTIRDIDDVGSVIDSAVSAGANTSYSLSFDISNRDEVYIEALGKAMQSVNEKARTVAQSGGYTIVRPQSIQEGGTSSYYNEMPMAAAAMEAQAVTRDMFVSPGDIEVSASVTGTFVIE
jgi:uncharacterized protein YggE